MKIFKAEVLVWSPVRVRFAPERGNQSFTFSERLYSESWHLCYSQSRIHLSMKCWSHEPQ